MSADSWNFLNVAGPFDFTEGPVWTGEVVLFTDIPNNRIMLSKDNLEIANSFLEALDDNDDVQNIYTNLNVVST